MQDLSVKRTLVKSPPELWSELSEVERLAKHLDAFGEIKITRLEPESTVAWEGEGASGTVSIEPSGWGTKVTLTARVEGEDPAPEPEPVPAPEPVAPEPEAPAAEQSSPPEDSLAESPREGWLKRFFGKRRPMAMAADAPVWVAGAPQGEAEPEPVEPEPVIEEPVAAEPVATEPVATEPEPEIDPNAPLTPSSAQAALESALEALGSAHHRPFSRG
jgi:hypothetical protein